MVVYMRAMQRSSRPGTFDEEDFDPYRRAWSKPEAIQSMIDWYRALERHPATQSGKGRISVPTLLIWGACDKFLGLKMAKPSIETCDEGRLVILDEATHWVHQEQSGDVNDLLISFLSDESPHSHERVADDQ